MHAGLMTLFGLLFMGAGLFARAERGMAMIAQYIGQGWADFVGYGLVGAGLALLLFGVIGMVAGAIAGLSGGRSGAENEKQARRRIETFHRLLGGAAARMAAMDGHVSASENAMVAGILEKYGNLRFTEKEIEALARGGTREAKGYLDSVREARKELTPEQREQIVRAALLVAMADLQTDDSELEFLRALADALGLDEDELKRIRNSVSSVTERLVSAAAAVA